MNTIEQKDNGEIEITVILEPGEIVTLPQGKYQVVGDLSVPVLWAMAMGLDLVPGESNKIILEK